ncbi:hypothetical protein IF1G_08742 [Cordyceps javanica]|uniref:Uncharacterized protein n=1 Tax=Cordyceps javanica TaxID=43265 RepID=A0A545UTM0_9HYPO|nr:hypothetical protein IF1G_08742 [Cordyceps javanica]TQW02134.1 hypothetical protein IF2G_10339 [Cordyceps javanica]
MPVNSEYTELFDSLKDLLRKDDSKNIIVIAVGSVPCVQELERCSDELFKESWHRKLRFWRGRPRPSVYFCTPCELPDALLDAEALCEERARRRERSVAIIASRAVSELDLHVGDQVRSLAVLGAKPRQHQHQHQHQLQHRTPSSYSSSSSSFHSLPSSRSQLTLRESSSFCDVPIAEWRRRQPSGYSLLTGPGVLVQSSLADHPHHQHRSNDEEELDEDARGAIRYHLETMEAQARRGRRGSGSSSSSGSSSPRRWKSSAAAILGVLTGAGVGMAAADSSGFSFRDGTAGRLARGGLSMKETLEAAGWGLGAGAAASLLVYVIPWEAFFAHLRDVLSGFWAWVCDLFSRLQDAVRSFRQRAAEERRRGRRRVGGGGGGGGGPARTVSSRREGHYSYS